MLPVMQSIYNLLLHVKKITKVGAAANHHVNKLSTHSFIIHMNP